MKIVYLDQNKWIQLARVYHGRDSEPELQEVLEFVKTATRNGEMILPLSAIHYMETARVLDVARRARLGTVMWELSQGYTMSSLGHVIRHEIEAALARRFPKVHPRRLSLVSKGVAHAFGMNYVGYRVPEPFRSRYPREVVQTIEHAGSEMIEKAAIVGTGPSGLVMPSFRNTTFRARFKKHLDSLYPRISQLPKKQWDDALYALILVDIQEPLNEVLQQHGLSSRDLEGLGKSGLTAFVREMPSRCVEVQLHRQVLKNPQLQARMSDLEDWVGLGLAAAYCDVLVCEKHFANLLHRDGFRTRASVITNLVELPHIVTAKQTYSAGGCRVGVSIESEYRRG